MCLPHSSATAAAASAASVAAVGSSPTTSHPAADLPSETNTSDTAANVHDGQTGLPPSSSSLSSLEEQLGKVFGSGGIRITSRSGLPQGSGMGTSSILAGESRLSLADIQKRDTVGCASPLSLRGCLCTTRRHSQVDIRLSPWQGQFLTGRSVTYMVSFFHV